MSKKDTNCSRCDCELQQPYEQNANYVLADDFCECELRDVHYAMVHTEETKKKLNKMDRLLPTRSRQALSAEMAAPEAPETVMVPAGTKTIEHEGGSTETADMREFEFSIPEDEFEHVQIDEPRTVRDDDDVARTYTTREECDVQKTGLICSDCFDSEGDKIIWGMDK